MIRFQSLYILSLVESSGRMCVGLAASLLYGFNPALPALISVDKPCFQSPYILSLVSRTDSIKIHLVDTDAVKPTVSPSLTEFSTVNWFCSQGTRSGGTVLPRDLGPPNRKLSRTVHVFVRSGTIFGSGDPCKTNNWDWEPK